MKTQTLTVGMSVIFHDGTNENATTYKGTITTIINDKKIQIEINHFSSTETFIHNVKLTPTGWKAQVKDINYKFGLLDKDSWKRYCVSYIYPVDINF